MLSLALALSAVRAGRGRRRPPPGYVFLTDADGALLKDSGGAFLVERA